MRKDWQEQGKPSALFITHRRAVSGKPNRFPASLTEKHLRLFVFRPLGGLRGTVPPYHGGVPSSEIIRAHLSRCKPKPHTPKTKLSGPPESLRCPFNRRPLCQKTRQQPPNSNSSASLQAGFFMVKLGAQSAIAGAATLPLHGLELGLIKILGLKA